MYSSKPRSFAPIYDLLHQEIKGSAEHLLEISQKRPFSLERDSGYVLERFRELQDFTMRYSLSESYHPLIDLKRYLEFTMISYYDDQKRLLTMRFSEAVGILELSTDAEYNFKEQTVHSLLQHFVKHFLEESRPGKPLFKMLMELHKL
jgi:hypothetical protein